MSRILGFLAFDVNISHLDINQCNLDQQQGDEVSLSNYFSNTHKCHQNTSQVKIDSKCTKRQVYSSCIQSVLKSKCAQVSILAFESKKK